jgi:indolepyruvate ferredoxin oxidoreductase, beta subunit
MNAGFDVLIVGIGGQGTILASNILGEACLIEGRSVRGAETHGMAQRGGSVESHIRINGIHGPLIAPGTADILIAFDMLEATRYAHYLKNNGTMIVNRHLVVPTSVFVQGLAAPSIEDLEQSLAHCSPCLIDAEAIALKAGSPLVQNVVIIGVAARHLPLSIASLREAIRRLVPPKTMEMNIKAFEMGIVAGDLC